MVQRSLVAFLMDQPVPAGINRRHWSHVSLKRFLIGFVIAGRARVCHHDGGCCIKGCGGIGAAGAWGLGGGGGAARCGSGADMPTNGSPKIVSLPRSSEDQSVPARRRARLAARIATRAWWSLSEVVMPSILIRVSISLPSIAIWSSDPGQGFSGPFICGFSSVSYRLSRWLLNQSYIR